MEKLKRGEIVLDCLKHPAISDEKDTRIIDTCNHFLGKILEGRVYVYCGRCKMFVHVVSIKK